MRLALKLCGLVLFVTAGSVAAAPPLEADGLRSVLIRGRVIAPIITPPAPLAGEVSLPGPIADPLPPLGIIGPEPTPAAPKLIVPPGGGRPAVRPPAIQAPLRGAINAIEGANHLASGKATSLGQSRDADAETSSRPRGFFRRRR
jgi:hypothetical protein